MTVNFQTVLQVSFREQTRYVLSHDLLEWSQKYLLRLVHARESAAKLRESKEILQNFSLIYFQNSKIKSILLLRKNLPSKDSGILIRATTKRSKWYAAPFFSLLLGALTRAAEIFFIGFFVER